MAFTAEDGTGVAGANAYATVAKADAYFVERGIAAWAALSNTAKEQSLVKATDYMESRFTFIGTRLTTTQALHWPILEILDSYGLAPLLDGNLPVNLKKACYEYALRASTTILAPDPVLDASGASTVTTRTVVGPIEIHKTVSDEPELLRDYPAADMMLKGLVVYSGGVIR
jgi:hypothetical protein